MRSPVRDGDDIHRFRRTEVLVPDLHRSDLALHMQRNLSNLVLRLVQRTSTGTLGDRHASSPTSARKLWGHSLCRHRGRLPLNPNGETRRCPAGALLVEVGTEFQIGKPPLRLGP